MFEAFLISKFERIIFCLFLEKDIELYEKYLSKFFPVPKSEEKTESESDKKEAEKSNDLNEIKSESTEVNTDENRIKLENLKCENDAKEETLTKEAETTVLFNTASNLKNEGVENDL